MSYNFPSTPRPRYCVVRPNGMIAPMIPIDELPGWLQIFNWPSDILLGLEPVSNRSIQRNDEYHVICHNCANSVGYLSDQTFSSSSATKSRRGLFPEPAECLVIPRGKPFLSNEHVFTATDETDSEVVPDTPMSAPEVLQTQAISFSRYFSTRSTDEEVLEGSRRSPIPAKCLQRKSDTPASSVHSADDSSSKLSIQSEAEMFLMTLSDSPVLGSHPDTPASSVHSADNPGSDISIISEAEIYMVALRDSPLLGPLPETPASSLYFADNSSSNASVSSEAPVLGSHSETSTLPSSVDLTDDYDSDDSEDSCHSPARSAQIDDEIDGFPAILQADLDSLCFVSRGEPIVSDEYQPELESLKDFDNSLAAKMDTAIFSDLEDVADFGEFALEEETSTCAHLHMKSKSKRSNIRSMVHKTHSMAHHHVHGGRCRRRANIVGTMVSVEEAESKPEQLNSYTRRRDRRERRIQGKKGTNSHGQYHHMVMVHGSHSPKPHR
ncbi:hypothetical protein N7495_009450 [Penicillium taxi]|uniref:uncharacterized protein n=1 Tax=Penicillium taxi TaxID=168475 RepID=UPI002545829A|nr:uncharacterized protein N7495_009450 [Penicillium taxi]KAJ5884940.1 hypothetical protein N7495_009450 [Penicillium taxi]